MAVSAGTRPNGAPEIADDRADRTAALASAAIERQGLADIEVMWVDHQGLARGKRIDAAGLVERARGAGFAFCNAALSWDITGEVKSGLRHSDWDSGFPDFYAVPDLATLRAIPWRERAGPSSVISSITTAASSPRLREPCCVGR